MTTTIWKVSHIEHARKGGLDIVLMDIMMPEMDGLETNKEIRKIPKAGRSRAAAHRPQGLAASLRPP